MPFSEWLVIEPHFYLIQVHWYSRCQFGIYVMFTGLILAAMYLNFLGCSAYPHEPYVDTSSFPGGGVGKRPWERGCCKYGGQYGGFCQFNCFWIQRGDGCPVRRTSRIWESVMNIAQYSAANVSSRITFPAFFPPIFTSSILIRHVCRSVWSAREAKPRFGAALVRSKPLPLDSL